MDQHPTREDLEVLSQRAAKTASEIVAVQYEKQIEKIALELEDIEEVIAT